MLASLMQVSHTHSHADIQQAVGEHAIIDLASQDTDSNGSNNSAQPPGASSPSQAVSHANPSNKRHHPSPSVSAADEVCYRTRVLSLAAGYHKPLIVLYLVLRICLPRA